MKKLFLYMAMCFPSLSAYALGLGNMTVHSYLDQPFDADIELLDIGDVPLSGIQVSLASPEDYKRVGLERALNLNSFTFTLEKRSHGKVIIHVRSLDRMSDPYVQLMIDLAWAEGEVYRAYTILLDPPDYQIALSNRTITAGRSSSTPNQPGVIDKPTLSEVVREPAKKSDVKGGVPYGPTVINESIWQIAQRYKNPEVTIQQMILGIVGTNSDAFEEGNLNGLKTGIKIYIPPTATVRKVPKELAELEVRAHDKAWQTKQPIVHELMPPYVDASAAVTKQEITVLGYPMRTSELPSISALVKGASKETLLFSRLIPHANSLFSASQDVAPTGEPITTKNQLMIEQQVKLKAEVDVATAAIESIRESNALLREQLQALQVENKRLHEQIVKREQAIQALQKQVRLIRSRQGLGGQVSEQDFTTEIMDLRVWILLALLLVGSLSLLYWWYAIRPYRVNKKEGLDKGEKIEPIVSPKVVMGGAVASESTQVIEEDMTETAEMPLHDKIEPEPELKLEPLVATQETSTELHKRKKALHKSKKISPQKIVSSKVKKHPLENLTPSSNKSKKQIEAFETSQQAPSSEEKEANIKSKKAIDTLLDLAKTYIGMGDVQLAKQSLNEVLEQGNSKQQTEAQRLMDELEKE